jgi:hypothetical protein
VKDSGFDGDLLDISDTPLTAILHVVGYLVRKTRKEVVIVHEICLEDNTVRWIHTIPRGMVREIQELAVNEPSKESISTSVNQDKA